MPEPAPGVGPGTALADLYRDLVTAGDDLGRTVRERAELQASMPPAGEDDAVLAANPRDGLPVPADDGNAAPARDQLDA